MIMSSETRRIRMKLLAITRALHRSVYNKFLDASYEIADKVEMIHPATISVQCRINTESTGMHEMLNDEHFKVLYYEVRMHAKVFHEY